MTILDERLRAPRLPAAGDTATRALRLATDVGRVVWLDALRIAAILAVITIHTVSPVTAGATVRTFSAAWWAGATMNAASLWCVPVFVAISGGLLLRPTRREPQPALTFYRRRLHRIGVPLVFWTALYLALRPTLFKEHYTPSQAVHDLASGHPFLQLYYLFVIAGLYAVAPALRLLTRRCSDQQLAHLACGVLTFNVVDYTLGGLLGTGSTNAVTEWLPFLGYFLAGAWLIKVPLSAKAARRAGVGVGAGLAATLVGTALLVSHFGWTPKGWYLLGYQSPTVVIMSLSVFVWVRAVAERRGWRQRRGVARIGQATFGIFLVHPLLLVPLLQRFGRPAHLASVLLGVPLIVVGVAVGAATLTLLLARVPVVRRVVT